MKTSRKILKKNPWQYLSFIIYLKDPQISDVF